MFRISKQLEISRRIRDCETTQELCQWFQILADSIGVQKARRLAANGFLTVKSQLDNQSIDKILSSAPTTTHPSNNNDTATHSKDSKMHTLNQSKRIPRCQLDSLPKGIIFHILSYLAIKSNLNVSMTSHSFHKKIQNDQCFHDQDCDIIQLDPQILTTIGKNNCVMQCLHTNKKIYICTPHNYPWSSSPCNNCPLSRLIDKIKNKNYDLLWFKIIWKNMKNIYVSNNYPCTLKHIPISWIFEDEHQVLKPINVFGAAPQEKGDSHINHSIIVNFAKCMKNYINDNPDKKFRKIQRIWYDCKHCDTIEILSSFGENTTGILIDLPRLWDNKSRFGDLKTFFKIFHKNLNWLEILIDDNNIGNNSIVSQLFKRDNKQLCDDLNKTKKQLSFNQFLKKHNCQNNSLPKHTDLAIDFQMHVPYSQSVLFKLLNNDKIIKLLNVRKSVKYLWLTSLPCAKEIIKHELDIKMRCQLTICKLDNLRGFDYTLDHPDYLPKEEEMAKFFGLAKEFSMQMVMKPTAKYVSLTIGSHESIDEKKFKHIIKIENKNELSQQNRDALKTKISSIVDHSINVAKQFCSKSGFVDVTIEQYFQFDRDYSMS